MSEKKSGIDNLIPFGSTAEAREKGRKGGIASGKARKAKKSMSEIAKCLLSADLTPKQAKKIKEMGYNPDEFTQWTQCIIGLIGATAKDGNVKAFDKLQEISGETVTSGTTEERKQADLLNAIQKAVTGEEVE